MMGIPLSQGVQLANMGAATAAAHAGSSWAMQAELLAQKFLASVDAGETFQAAHVRRFAFKQGLPAAPDSRAWGHIMRCLQRQGLIRPAGVGRSREPRQHAGYTTEWELV
jgi:hypothetical protein